MDTKERQIELIIKLIWNRPLSSPDEPVYAELDFLRTVLGNCTKDVVVLHLYGELLRLTIDTENRIAGYSAFAILLRWAHGY